MFPMHPMKVGLGAVAVVLAMAVVLLLGGCNQGSQESRQQGGESQAGVSSDRSRITIKGSDTEVNLVQRLAEEYMNANAGAQISVTGGGSGTGIAALINRQTDIANSSRPMKDDEIQQARRNGVEPMGIVFAMDGLAVIVNAANPVEELTIEQVAGLYSGRLTQWNDVGGGAAAVSLYGRQSNSGTFVYFRDEVVKADYSPRMKSMNGTAQIVEGVRQDSNGIGYVGIGYVADENGQPIAGIKVMRLARAAEEEAVSPLDAANVNSGKYPLSRPLYQYVNGRPEGDVLKYIQFEVGAAGQKIVEGEGYYPVAAQYLKDNEDLGIQP